IVFLLCPEDCAKLDCCTDTPIKKETVTHEIMRLRPDIRWLTGSWLRCLNEYHRQARAWARLRGGDLSAATVGEGGASGKLILGPAGINLPVDRIYADDITAGVFQTVAIGRAASQANGQ